MKMDRLLGITLYLLNRETVSAAELAARFEVSKRTIQRDIDALNLAGVPVSATRGAQGGYEILDGFKLQKQIAKGEDYLNMVTALKGLLSAYADQRIQDTLEKVVSAMPKAEQHVFIDLSSAREGINTDEHLQTIEAAIQRGVVLHIEYVNAQQKISSRMVEPLALTYQWYAWYLLAFCHQKQDYRLFKLSRMSACVPTEQPFSRQHGPVETLLKQQLAADTRPYLEIQIRCQPAVRQQVLEYLSGTIIEAYPNGDFLYHLRVPETERMWFSLLLSFGDQIEVLSPPDLRDRLRQTAEKILSIYSRTGC